MLLFLLLFFFFFNDTATTEIYTLSLHDALPIFLLQIQHGLLGGADAAAPVAHAVGVDEVLRDDPGAAERRDDRDRKSTRLNSSHANISYAVFCLKKKKKTNVDTKNTNEILYMKH